ncbi:recombinase family protein [Anaerotignum sp.]|nr:recombinase family protein [Anaerotignum sp.]MBQ7758267.1 recombinase family protein [Anaerotignum sp.]
MAYCIYLRKSRADAEAELAGEGETLARHEKTLLALATKLKLSITKIYREILSGETIAGRPVMQQLLHDIEAGLWDGVLVMEVERLGRGDTMDQGIILNAFKYSSTKIVTPVKTYDPNDEFDEEYFEFSQFMSRREYKTILRRMQRGREASAREGKYAGNIPPFGYRRVKLENEKGYTLEIEPEEAAAVRLAFELYAYGDPQPDGTTKETGRATVAKRLHEMGIKNRKGGTWATSSVTRMLQNPVYIGKIHWNRRPGKKSTENGKIKISRPISENYLLADGLHEPIITEELWNIVQAKMKSRTYPTNIGPSKNPLAGLVRCSYCGNLMQRRPFNKTGQPASLICATHNCPQISAALYMVENKVLDGLSQWVKQHEATWEQTATPSDAFLGKIMALKNSIEAMEKELEGLKLQFDNTFDLLEKGIYSADVFTKRNAILNEKITATTNEIEETKKELRSLETANSEQISLLPKIKTLLETYDSLPAAEQNRMLKDVLDHIEYHKEVNGRWHNSPDDFMITLYPKVSRTF